MPKFKELISPDHPVLINLYSARDDGDNLAHTLQDVAAALGDRAEVIQIDTDVNQRIAHLLKVRSLPTHIIYRDKKMLWRSTGHRDANALISQVEQYLGKK